MSVCLSNTVSLFRNIDLGKIPLPYNFLSGMLIELTALSSFSMQFLIRCRKEWIGVHDNPPLVKNINGKVLI